MMACPVASGVQVTVVGEPSVETGKSPDAPAAISPHASPSALVNGLVSGAGTAAQLALPPPLDRNRRSLPSCEMNPPTSKRVAPEFCTTARLMPTGKVVPTTQVAGAPEIVTEATETSAELQLTSIPERSAGHSLAVNCANAEALSARAVSASAVVTARWRRRCDERHPVTQPWRISKAVICTPCSWPRRLVVMAASGASALDVRYLGVLGLGHYANERAQAIEVQRL